jgi:hypothetical protein
MLEALPHSAIHTRTVMLLNTNCAAYEASASAFQHDLRCFHVELIATRETQSVDITNSTVLKPFDIILPRDRLGTVSS